MQPLEQFCSMIKTNSKDTDPGEWLLLIGQLLHTDIIGLNINKRTIGLFSTLLSSQYFVFWTFFQHL